MNIQKPTPKATCAPEGLKTNEHLAPQKCTVAAAVSAGGPEQIIPDERSHRQLASGPAARREAGERADPSNSPTEPGVECPGRESWAEIPAGRDSWKPLCRAWLPLSPSCSSLDDVVLIRVLTTRGRPCCLALRPCFTVKVGSATDDGLFLMLRWVY